MIARRARVGAAAAALAALLAGCGNKPTHRQTGDATAVEVVTAPVLPDGGAKGAISDEIEPNDADEVATLLPPGATVHGKIDPDADVDRYRIDITAAGQLAISVDGHDALDPTLEIVDPSGAVVARSDRTGVRIREGVPNLGVTPGRYIAIVTARKPAAPPAKKRPAKRGAPAPAPEPAKPIGGPYEIIATLVAPSAGAEWEPDDDRGAANALIAGDTGTGYLGWTGDVDVWKTSVETLSARNALDIELSAVEGIVLSLEIADGIGQPMVTRKGARGAPLVVRGFAPTVPAGAPPYFYLTVKGDRSNPETAYQIRATAKLVAPDTESEPNDTPDTATVVADRKTVRGVWSTGDVDCFAVPPADIARTFDVSLDTPRDLDLALELLIDGKLVEKVDHPGKGAAEKLVMTVPPRARAVIRVRGAELPGEAGYELVIDESAAPP
jgi:hypothetical protein